MTTDYLDRLDRLPPSATLTAFRDALAAFLIADRAGRCTPTREWDDAYNGKNAAFDALSYQEKEAVRQCGEGR